MKFAKCLNPSEGLMCMGVMRSYNLPNCECLEGYFDDGVSTNCIKCISPCKTC